MGKKKSPFFVAAGPAFPTARPHKNIFFTYCLIVLILVSLESSFQADFSHIYVRIWVNQTRDIGPQSWPPPKGPLSGRAHIFGTVSAIELGISNLYLGPKSTQRV